MYLVDVEILQLFDAVPQQRSRGYTGDNTLHSTRRKQLLDVFGDLQELHIHGRCCDLQVVADKGTISDYVSSM